MFPFGESFVKVFPVVYISLTTYQKAFIFDTAPHSTVGNVSDCRSSDPKFDLSLVHTFMEIDHEIISIAILLPSADSRRVVVSYK